MFDGASGPLGVLSGFRLLWAASARSQPHSCPALVSPDPWSRALRGGGVDFRAPRGGFGLLWVTPAQSGGQVAALRGQGKGSFPSPQREVTGTLVSTSQAPSKEAARPQEAEKDQLVHADGPGLSRRTDPRRRRRRRRRDGWHRGAAGGGVDKSLQGPWVCWVGKLVRFYTLAVRVRFLRMA